MGCISSSRKYFKKFSFGIRHIHYLKKKQKSNPPSVSCRGNTLHMAGKRKNHPITRRMIAMMIAGIPIWAVSFSMKSPRD
jgi:hypothetical protein